MSRRQFEDKLRNRAAEFIRRLCAAGLEASIVEPSFRDYSVKVSIVEKGTDSSNVVIYYRPRSDTFSLETHEVKDKSILPILESCWDVDRVAETRSGYEIYVDGSFMNDVTGYGAVILNGGDVIEELSGVVDASEVSGTYQVAGELAAVKESLKWCHAHSVKEVSIYYDYLGVEKWASGEWKTNQPLTQEYARFIRESGIDIHWHKVAAHTGNRWNERADALAKKGTASGASAAGDNEFLSELLEKIEDWIEFLMVKGIEASFDRVYNQQFARVLIVREDKAVGTFDLYNTRKKRFSPYMHDFRDPQLELQIASLWKEFVATGE